MEYCTFQANWPSAKELKRLVCYTVLSEKDEEVLEDNMEDDNVSVANPYNIEFFQDNETDEPLQVCVRCKKHFPIQLLGAAVISEAKTVECYGENDGYVGTARGIRLDLDRADVVGMDIETRTKLYKCTFHFEDSLQEVTLKFLGLGEKRCITFYKLMPVLLQCQNGRTLPASGFPRQLDLSRVKGYLHSMGDTIPENAMQLLQSVEQFQKTQMGGMQQFQAMFSNLSTSTSPGSDLSAGRDGCESPTPKCETSGDLSAKVLPSSVSDIAHSLGPLQAMMQSVARQHGEVGNQYDGGGQGFMYDMLKNICGKVSDLRTPQSVEEDVAVDRPDVPNSETSDGVKDSSPAEVTVSSLTGEDVQAIVQQALKHTEEKLMVHINETMVAMETRLTNKLTEKLDSFFNKLEESLIQRRENT